MERINWQRVFYHISFWVVYLGLNAVLTCILHRQPIPDAIPDALIGEAFVLPIKIALVYFVFYYIIPLYLERDKLGKLLGLTILGFMVTILIYRLIIAYIYYPIFDPKTEIQLFFGPGIYLTAFDCFITLAAAVTVKMIRLHYKSIEFEQQLIREKLQSELNFLRAQTNPHFLFNTLNNLYVLARKKSDKTPDAIMMLSQIMRFVLYDCRHPRIRLSNEAKVIQDYIELEKLRYNQRLSVEYEASIDQPHASIAPLLLLPLVENAFKHGAHSTTGDAKISIHLQLHKNQLKFSVENTAPEAPTTRLGDNNGIGLKNIQRQLDLIYPEQHTLQLKHQDGHFSALLLLNLLEE